MAFVNEKLTSEQREEFASKGIINPETMSVLSPMYLTIDIENDAWLAWCYNHRDVDENLKTYMFMYKNNPIILQGTYYDTGKLNCHWKIRNVKLPTGFNLSIDEVSNQIIKAFEAYKAIGWPDEQNQEISATCAFEEGVNFSC